MIRLHHPTCRLTSTVAVAALMMGVLSPAYAQQVLAGPSDPPARVGGLARLEGTVWFHTADEDHWEPGTLNYPVTSGNAFWTQQASGADLDIGRTRITLDQSTKFSVDTLDDARLVGTALQGRTYVKISALAPSETATVRTPRGTVTFSRPGRYEIAVGDTDAPTLVVVDEGMVQVSGPGFSVSVGQHQIASITGNDNFTAAVLAEAPDSFLSAQIAREQPIRAEGTTSPPPQVLQMSGYQAVADTGQWTDAPEYGRVWYPPVDHDWVPYRHGHWSWVAPWGWTWVDDASWGFAPFHYGRWVEISDRWAWTPVDRGYAEDARPVYAPALVTFVGAAAGVAIGIGVAGAVGWIPLGPREVYRPPYRVSDTYIRRVNVSNVTNVTNINNTTINNTQVSNRYVNQGATTVVPATVMQRSQGVAALARQVPAAQQAGFQPVARPAVLPTLATRGVTPAVARSTNIQSQPGVPTDLSVGPGPSFRTQARAGAAALVQPGGNGPSMGAIPPRHVGEVRGPSGQVSNQVAVSQPARTLHQVQGAEQPQVGRPMPSAIAPPRMPAQEGAARLELLKRETISPSSPAQQTRPAPSPQPTRPATLEPIRQTPLPQAQRLPVPNPTRPVAAPQVPHPISIPQRARPAEPHFLPPSTPRPPPHPDMRSAPAPHKVCPSGHPTC